MQTNIYDKHQKNSMDSIINKDPPPKITNYFSGEKLGFISGSYQFKEKNNITYLYASKIHILNNVCLDISGKDLANIPYRIFDKKFIMTCWSQLYTDHVVMIVEHAEFFEDPENQYNPYENFYEAEYNKLFTYLTKNYNDFIKETSYPSESPAEIAIRLLEETKELMRYK